MIVADFRVAKILRNGTEDRFESDNFKSGDDFYLSYQSSTKGYVAVYQIDDSKNAYCLLPYQSSQDGKVRWMPTRDTYFSIPRRLHRSFSRQT